MPRCSRRPQLRARLRGLAPGRRRHRRLAPRRALLPSGGPDRDRRRTGPRLGAGHSVASICSSCCEGCGDLLERFGGHRMAAGLTIRRDRTAALAERFEAAVRRWTHRCFVRAASYASMRGSNWRISPRNAGGHRKARAIRAGESPPALSRRAARGGVESRRRRAPSEARRSAQRRPQDLRRRSVSARGSAPADARHGRSICLHARAERLGRLRAASIEVRTFENHQLFQYLERIHRAC